MTKPATKKTFSTGHATDLLLGASKNLLRDGVAAKRGARFLADRLDRSRLLRTLRLALGPLAMVFRGAPLLIACGLLWSLSAHALRPAFYYGPFPFPQALRHYDTWIIEPNQIQDAQFVIQNQARLFAYVSLGEVTPDRAWLKKLPAAWLRGENKVWKSRLIDQSAAGWPAFYVDEVIEPLWQQGYRNFFIDTLDSYHLFTDNAQARQRQEDGIVATLRLLKSRHPEAKLILNRGFEVLPRIKEHVHAVAAESLFQSWDNTAKRYKPVSEADRTWLLARLAKVRDDYGLPVIVVDYAPVSAPNQARDIAARIRALGFIPWVADGDLSHLGIGAIDPAPRTILMLYDEAPESDLRTDDIHRLAAMPMNHLGYVPEYRNIRTEGLPQGKLAGRYAGVITWFHTTSSSRPAELRKWFIQQISDGVPIAVLGYFGFELEGSDDLRLGLKVGEGRAQGPVKVLFRKPEAAFEAEPLPEADAFFPLKADSSADVWLRAGDGRQIQDAIAITRWGGYALQTFFMTHVRLEDDEVAYWTIDPFAFFKRSLRLPDFPVPDVTTENGRRLLMVHIDGDGFANRAEMPGTPWAAEVLYEQILKRHAIPTTMSVIEGEISAEGLYPHLSQELEPIARKIFALPHIEAASHSYSHPFVWQPLRDAGEGEAYNLVIPGYTRNGKREIEGSVRYVQRLLPPGKQCRLFLWTGDCNPSESSLRLAYNAGLLNMNGGETMITRRHPSLTQVAPLGILRGSHFQVYAPNQNENVYTNNWTGPFGGYERVIETFELTDKPRRLKPINIYYHTYSASKIASLKALKKVYDWALAQPTLKLHVADYIRKVHDFNAMAIAREGEGWRIEGGHEVRTLRIPAQLGYPDLSRSHNVLGWWDEGDTRYVHLGDAPSSFLMLSQAPAQRPWLARANGRVKVMPSGWRFEAAEPLELEFGGAARCAIRMNGKPVKLHDPGNGLSVLRTSRHTANIEVQCAE